MRRLTVIAAIAAVAGCRSPTQITVEVSADDVVCVASLETQVSVGSLAEISAGRPPATTTTGCSGGHVGSVVLIPSGGDGDEVAFRVLASLDGTTDCATSFGPECIAATRALRYLPHEPLTVQVPLRASCEGVLCADPTETCVSGACVPATLDPTQCEGNGCGEGALGAGDAGVDATVADAGVDADADASANTTADASVEAAADATTASDAAVSPTIVLALGDESSCALLPGGTVKCWGTDSFGELGIGDAGSDASARPPAPVVDLPASIATIAGGQGARHVCALASGGAIYCWGANEFGQLGIDTGGNASGIPVVVPGAPVVSSLSLGTWLTCAIAGAGSQVNCWGNWGAQTTAPGAIIPGTVAPNLSVSAGPQVACEASGDAGVSCWGFDDGLFPPDGGTAVVQQTPGTEGVVEVGIGAASACGRRADGSVTCWGTNDFGALGFPGDGQVHAPTAIALPAGRSATHLAVGNQHVCALLDDATVACWGQNDASQCGANAVGSEEDTPVLVPGVASATYLAAGTNHTCAVLGGTGVVCWGANDSGQLGTTSYNTGVPQPVSLGP